MTTRKKKPTVRRYVHPIRQRLKELSRTVVWLAGQVGCTTATIRNYMYGRNEISPFTLRKICRVLGVTQNYIFGLTKSVERSVGTPAS